jgi:hypothetical protein
VASSVAKDPVPDPGKPITWAAKPIPVTFVYRVTATVMSPDWEGLAVAWQGDAVLVQYDGGGGGERWVWAADIERQ